MSWDAYEALAARDPRLGRTILVDLGRGLAARLRAAGHVARRVDGMTAFPNYTQIPARLPVGAWQAIRVVTLLGAIGLALALVVVPDDGLYVMWKVVIPRAAVAVAGRARPVAQHLPAVGVQPDAARARALQGPDRARVAEGVRLRDRRGAVHRVRLAAQGRPRRLRPRERAAAARRAHRRLRRRDAAEGQERLVLVDLPAAADPAAVRPDALQARRQHPLHAVRGLHEVLLRLQPEGRVPRRPERSRTHTGAATASCSRPRSRASSSRSSRCPRRAARTRSRRSTGSSRSTSRPASRRSSRSTRC